MHGHAPATILHADLDAFYASVEQLLDPSLRGRPIAVGGGVVLAASYEAKAFGVAAGMPGWRARRLCPGLTFTGGHFSEYQRLGDAVMRVLDDFTPLVERMSIDEAFLDVTGSVHLLGPPVAMARAIRQRVRDELGLPISIGVATTKHLAKVASQVAKPDGLVHVEAGTERDFLAPLPVGLLWGVGPATRERLASRGIHTVGALAATDPAALHALLGRALGDHLGARAANRDDRKVGPARQAKSMGAQSALGRRAATDEVLRVELGFLADRVAGRLRAKELAARTVTVRVRFADMRSVSHATTVAPALSDTRTLAEVAVDLARAVLDARPDERELTLVAISAGNLVPALPLQLALPFARGPGAGPGTPRGVARAELDRAVDRVRDRFGGDAVGRAATLLRAGGVPDAFRELAESD